jgi:hypothetical protein
MKQKDESLELTMKDGRREQGLVANALVFEQPYCF